MKEQDEKEKKQKVMGLEEFVPEYDDDDVLLNGMDENGNPLDGSDDKFPLMTSNKRGSNSKKSLPPESAAAGTKTAMDAEDKGKDIEREIQEVATANKKSKDVKVPDSKIGTKQFDDSLSPSPTFNRHLNGGMHWELFTNIVFTLFSYSR